MRAHFKYLSYVARHKWYVFRAGLITGAPLWRLLIHDCSKFLPSEWFPYVANFYGAPPFLNPAETSAGWRKDEEKAWKERTRARFDHAWLRHQHRNPHHWQAWVLREDSGKTKYLPIPEPFMREMVADWMGAGRAITGKWDVNEWYTKNSHNIMLHPDTQDAVERMIDHASTRMTAP